MLVTVVVGLVLPSVVFAAGFENPSFETGAGSTACGGVTAPAPWFVTGISVGCATTASLAGEGAPASVDSYAAFKVSAFAGAASLYQDLDVRPRPGESYTFSVWLKHQIVGQQALVVVRGMGDGAAAQPPVTQVSKATTYTVSSTGWTQVSVPLDVASSSIRFVRVEVTWAAGAAAGWSVDGAEFHRELLQDPSFEASAVAPPGCGNPAPRWVQGSGTASCAYTVAGAPSGSAFLEANTNAAGNAIHQDVSIRGGSSRSYTFSADVFAPNGATGYVVVQAWGGGGSPDRYLSTGFTGNGAYQRVAVTVDPPAASTLLRVFLQMQTPAMNYRFDNASLRAELVPNLGFDDVGAPAAGSCAGFPPGWGSWQAGSVAWCSVGSIAKSGTSYVQVATGAALPAVLVRDFPYRPRPGDSFTVTAWARSYNPVAHSVRLSLAALNGGLTTLYIDQQSSAATSQTWKQLRVTATVAPGIDAASIGDLRIQLVTDDSAPGPNDVVQWDSVSLTLNGADSIPVGAPGYLATDDVSVGGGGVASTVLASGENAVAYPLLSSPGVGVDTTIGVSYASFDGAPDSPLGLGWSVSAGGLSRVGSRLRFARGELASRTPQLGDWVDFTDGAGTVHRFVWVGYWREQAGDHLWLRWSPPASQWKITTTSQVTYSFDTSGLEVAAVDEWGKGLTFGYTNGNLVTVTDSTLRVYALTWSGNKLASVTDHRGSAAPTGGVGRKVVLAYWSDDVGGHKTGCLGRITTSAPNDAGARHRWFWYDLAAPGCRLVQVQDVTGYVTKFTYDSVGRASTRADRADNALSRPSGTNWVYGAAIPGYANETDTMDSTTATGDRRTTTRFDDRAQAVETELMTMSWPGTSTHPLSRQGWDADRHVVSSSGIDARSAGQSFDRNGALVSSSAPGSLTTSYFTAFAAIPSASGEPTDTRNHLTVVSQVQTPGMFMDSGFYAPIYPTTYTYGLAGHPTVVTKVMRSAAPITGNFAGVPPVSEQVTEDYSYDANGQLSEKLSSWSTDGVTKQAMLYGSYDANGLPTLFHDGTASGASRTWHPASQVRYDADGVKVWSQDALHIPLGNATYARATFYEYNEHDQLKRTITPKSSVRDPNRVIVSRVWYDSAGRLGGVLRQVEDTVTASNTLTHGSDWPVLSGAPQTAYLKTIGYDAMDRVNQEVDALSHQQRTTYDLAGRPVFRSKPSRDASSVTGVALSWPTAAVPQDSTEIAYDQLDRAVRSTVYGDATGSRTALTCYDALAGSPAFSSSLTDPLTGSAYAAFTAGMGDPRATIPPSGYAAGERCTTPVPAHGSFAFFDTGGRRVGTRDPLGYYSVRVPDRDGNVIATVEPGHQAVTTKYDGAGRPTEKTIPFDATLTLHERWAYDLAANVVTHWSTRASDTVDKGSPTLGNSASTGYTYDDRNQQTVERLPWDRNNQKPQKYRHYAYDEIGRLKKSTADTTSTTFPTDQTGRMGTTDYAYYDTGQILEHRAPEYTTNTSLLDQFYCYSPEGWQTAIILGSYGCTANGGAPPNAESWAYNGDGSQASHQGRGAGAATMLFSYDTNGNRILYSKTPNAGTGMGISYTEYDEVRQTRQHQANGEWYHTDWTYTNDGLIASRLDSALYAPGDVTVTQPARSNTFTYDNAGQLDTMSATGQTSGGGATATDNVTVAFSWYPDGRPDRRSATRPDVGGGFSAVTLGYETRTYYENGLVKRLQTQYNAGSTAEDHTYTYLQNVGAPSGPVYVENPTADHYRVIGPTAGTDCRLAFCDASWGYDPYGHVVTYDNGHGYTGYYEYEQFGLMSKELVNGTTQTLTSYAGLLPHTRATTGQPTLFYGFNAYGGIGCAATSGLGYQCSNLTSTNRVSSTSFDSFGRQSAYTEWLSDHTSTHVVTTNTLDDLDRVQTSHVITGKDLLRTFSYVGQSHSIGQETTFTGAGGFIDRRSTDTTPSGLTAMLSYYNAATSAGGRGGPTQNRPTAYMYSYNQHGDPAMLLGINNDGTAETSSTIKQVYQYHPYGDTDTETSVGQDTSWSEPVSPIKFNNSRYDAGTVGGTDFGPRVYTPGNREFTAMDTKGDAGGEQGLSLNPWNQGRFGYAGGNPVARSELDGYESCSWCTSSAQQVQHESKTAGDAFSNVRYSYGPHPGGKVPGGGTVARRVDPTAYNLGGDAATFEFPADNQSGRESREGPFPCYGRGMIDPHRGLCATWTGDPLFVFTAMSLVPFGGASVLAVGAKTLARGLVRTAVRDAAEDAVPAFARSQYGRMTAADRAGALERSPSCPYCGEAPSTQADHITSLKQDWTSGGWRDDVATRTARVNDSENLIGACGPCNASKGARQLGEGPGQWWPGGWGPGQWWPFGGPK